MKFPLFWKIAVLTITQATLSPALAAPASSAGYTVKSGDTFAKIARSRGISLSALLKANKISNPDRIQLGQRIVVPGSATVAKTTTKAPVKQTAKTTSKNAEVKTVAKTSTKAVEKTEKTTRPVSDYSDTL